MLILLLINIAIISLVFWCRHRLTISTIIEDLLILEIGSTVFNILVGLILLFDFMEAHPTEVGKNLLEDSATMISLITLIVLSLVHAGISIVFIAKSAKKSG